MKSKVILLTAGLAPKNFRRAANRLKSDANELFEFEAIHVLQAENLEKNCPTVFKTYRTYLNEKTKGYGFWCWKPEFIYRTLKGDFGECNQVVWIDSGCEINSNLITRSIFRARIKSAQENGTWMHAIKSSDFQYSKRSLISQFPSLDIHKLRNPQIQANYLHLSGEVGLSIARKWLELTVSDINNIDLSSSKEESGEFVEHRSDQSILSLVTKSLNRKHNRMNLPNGSTLKSQIRGILEPVWISRNRDGETVVPNFLKKIP